MAVVNRTLDASEQRKLISASYGKADLVNGLTNMIGVVPYPGTIDQAAIAVIGVSGSPAYTLSVARFIVGTGATTYAVSGSLLPVAWGTSGVLVAGVSLPAAGSTLLNVLANDVLLLATLGGTGAAVDRATVSVVVKPLQDIKTHFGSSV